MNPTLQPRIFTFYFSLYFHDPPDPADLPTYMVFFPARLARARMDGRARGVRYKSGRTEGVEARKNNNNNRFDPYSAPIFKPLRICRVR